MFGIYLELIGFFKNKNYFNNINLKLFINKIYFNLFFLKKLLKNNGIVIIK